MSEIKYRLTNWDMTKGFELNEIIILKTIKICYHRNYKLAEKYIRAYEHLTEKKFDKKLLEDI